MIREFGIDCMRHATTGMVLLLIIRFSAPQALASESQTSEFALVVGTASTLNNVSRKEVSRLFLALSRSLDGKRVLPVSLSEGKWQFLERLTKKSRQRIEKSFVELELRGEGRPAAEVTSASAMAELLSRSSKAIGWLPTSALDSLVPERRAQIKVLMIDGIKPGAAGYCLAP